MSENPLASSMDLHLNRELMVITIFIYIRSDYAIRDVKNESMVCGDGNVLVKTINQCLEGKRVAQLCQHSEQCQYFDTNTYCDQNWMCVAIPAPIRTHICPDGQEFNQKLDKCMKKLSGSVRTKLKELALSLRARNSSALNNLNQLLLANVTRRINLFSLLDKSGSHRRNGICYERSNGTAYSGNLCETNPFLVYSSSLLMTLMFSVAFVSLILMFYRRRHNETINLFQTLNAFNFGSNTALAPNVYFVAIPSSDNALPSYQECTETSNEAKLPSYEEAVAGDDRNV